MEVIKVIFLTRATSTKKETHAYESPCLNRARIKHGGNVYLTSNRTYTRIYPRMRLRTRKLD